MKRILALMVIGLGFPASAEESKPPAADSPGKHWAFTPPASPPVPSIDQAAWAENPIDAFIAARHKEVGLKANDPADKRTLIRRVYLDLIGLPPTPEQVRAFLDDGSPRAYEKVVDELLASPRYGERWGRHWMDVWRYSDWYGFGAEIRNSQYHIWRWRDWIVESLNDDKPYDRMIVEMLAGDEVAPTEPDTLRATGYLARNWFKFNRNIWLDNTVEHTAKAFLGVTMNCARCHDHKYDPVSQEDYYRFRAYFEPYEVRAERLPGEPDVLKAGVARVYDGKPEEPTYLYERGIESRPVKDKPLGPGVPAVLCATTPEIKPVELPVESYYPGVQSFIQQETLAAADTARVAAEKSLTDATTALAAARQQLTDFQAGKLAAPADALANAGAFLTDTFAQARPDVWAAGVGQWEYSGGLLTQRKVASEMQQFVAVKPHPADFHAKLRFRTTGGSTYRSVGLAFDHADAANFCGLYVTLMDNSPGLHTWLKSGGRDIYPPDATKAIPDLKAGQEITLDIAVRGKTVNAWVDGRFALAIELPIERRAGGLALWTYDASAEFVELKVDALPQAVAIVAAGGQPVAAKTAADHEAAVNEAESKHRVAEAARAAAAAQLLSARARVTADRAVYARSPNAEAESLKLIAAAAERQAALRQTEASLIQAESEQAAAQAALKEGDAKTQQALEAAKAKVAETRKAVETAQANVGKTDGAYSPLTAVYPRTSTGRRLAMAKWIADRRNPLTARVAVNHIWLRHFGAPLVTTVFDFGQNGAKPTHPELLDYLAVRFMDEGWSMKALHRLIVTSRAYQLSSGGGEGEASNLSIDPDNKLLWRQNVRRMESELVRDSVLHVAGGLDLTLGGPEMDEAAALTTYRRSIYYRHAPEKQARFLAVFDTAPPTECYRREQSIVPQQALAMVNSVLTLEQARGMSGTLCKAVGTEADERNDAEFITLAFDRLLCRPPTDEESKHCLGFLAEQTKLLADAASLTPFAGEATARLKPADQPHLRARENLIQVLMNHNDFVTIR